MLPVRFGTAMADDRRVVEELLAPRHDELVADLAELAGKVQITVKGDFDEERLLRGVVDASPAIARLRERVAGVPEAAAYYDRIRLGQLIAEEVEHARQHDAARVVERLEPLAVATSIERVSSLDAAVNAAFLVEQERSRSSGARWRSSAREFARRRRPALRGAAAALQLLGRRLAAEERGMGLITGLITLPLAPVRGTAWLAERLLEQAEAEYYSEERIRDTARRGRRGTRGGGARPGRGDSDRGRAARAAAHGARAGVLRFTWPTTEHRRERSRRGARSARRAGGGREARW